MEAKWVEPESNQPSSVSSSLVKWTPPQWGHLYPAGRMSAASLSYQALDPWLPKSLLTASMVASSHTGLPQSWQ